MKKNAILDLENIFVSQDNKDIRAKIKALIGYDIPSIINAWANHLGYANLQNKDITKLLLDANILDDEYIKFLQSLQAMKNTTNRLSKQDFISLFKELLANTGSMDSALPYIEDIINYLGQSLYLVILSGLDVQPFSFMDLKAKHQQATYKNPQNQAETINQLEYTAHPRIRSLKVKQTIKPPPPEQPAQTTQAQTQQPAQQTDQTAQTTQTTQAQTTQTEQKQYIAWPPDAQYWWTANDGTKYPGKVTSNGNAYWDGYEWRMV